MNIYKSLKKTLNLKYHIIGLKLVFENKDDLEFEKKFPKISEKDRFSKYIKRVSQGEALEINQEFTNCITSEGSTRSPSLSDHIEMDMKLNIRGLSAILLFPIDQYPDIEADSIILIVNPVQCTRIIEVYAELYNEPLRIVMGAHYGVCSEIVAYVIKREDVNLSFLCHGARKYGGFKNSELLCGIPKIRIEDIIMKLTK